MKDYLSKIREIISLIFLEPSTSDVRGVHVIETKHYKNEVKELFLDSVSICTAYRDIHTMLEAYKYRSERDTSKVFSKLIASSPLFSSLGNTESVYIVPVPMHWSRYLIRSYNHIELLAKEVSKLTHIKHKSLLVTKYSYRQSKLTKLERTQNRKDTFLFKKGSDIPEEVILLDDVISTGSTANECAKVLKDAGVKKVYGLFLASNQD